uniref:Coiled-coil domain-containing protein 141 n=1 Tax=Macrostomum lignano TaxID=282301 RepID=A0A1I8GGR1_9PLAT
MGNQASRRSTAKLARNRASVAESVNLTSSHFDYTVPENLQQSTAHSAVFNQFCRTAKEHRKTSANYCGEINFELLRLPTEQTLPLKERKDIGLELEQLLKSEQCSLADAQVAFEKLRSAKNCPGKVHRQFKKLQQASDEYVEQLQQALNRREISEAMDKWAHCHREFSRMQSKFNEWQKLKEEFSASFNDENLTSRYKSLQDTAKLAVRKMESSVCLHIAFNSHVSEFRSWLDQQVLRIGAVLKKSDNEVCLQPLADDLEIKVAEEKLKQLTDIEKCFDGKETDWLIKTRFYGRALIESCRESAYLQRDTEIRISEMESRSKKVKKLRESLSASVEIQERFEEELKSFRNWSTEARASEANLLINTSLEPVNAAAASAQLSEVKYLQCEVEHHSSSLTRIAEIGQSLAQSDEFNAGLREHILKQRKGNEKLYNKLKVQLESKKLIESEISNGKLHNLTRAIEAGEGLKQKSNCPPYVATHVKEVEGLWCSLDYKLAGVQNEVKHSIRKRLEVRQQLQEADSRLKGLETLFNDLSRQK